MVSTVVLEVVSMVVQAVVQEPVQDIDTRTGPSELSVCTDGGFPGGPSDRSVLTGYTDHVAYRIWQGDVSIIGLV